MSERRQDNEPKRDDRSDNAEKLQEMIGDTLHNMDEAKERMEWAPEHEKEEIHEKNKRRKEAIKGFRNEIQDELEQ